MKVVSLAWIPLFLSEFYLLITLMLICAGPFVWPIENKEAFWIFISLYHISFVAGFSFKFFKFAKNEKQVISKDSDVYADLYIKFFWVILILAFLANLIAHKNLVRTESYLPVTFLSDFWRGVTKTPEVRKFYGSAEYANKFSGNVYVTSLLLFLSIFKYSLLPAIILLWEKLSFTKRCLGFLVSLIPIVSAISISISATGFAYIFTFIIIFGLILLQTRSFAFLKKRVFLSISFVLLFIFTIFNFYHAKSNSTLLDALSNKSTPTRLEYLKEKGVVFKSEKSATNAYHDLYEKIVMYLVNGYVGMSISIGEEFRTTYGAGHSVFLSRILDKHLNFNISSRTYQERITKKWDKDIYWHSAYSYFANDVSFYGVVLVMFILGYFLASISISSILQSDFIASLLMPLCGILILYLPANNQIFSFLETASSFWILVFLYFFRLHFNKKSSRFN